MTSLCGGKLHRSTIDLSPPDLMQVSPKQIPLKIAGKDMELILAPYSFTSFDLLEQHIGSQDGEKLIHLQDPSTKKGSEGKDERSYQ